MLQQLNNSKIVDKKKIYYCLLLLPLTLMVFMICCIYHVPSLQKLFLSFFNQCKNSTIQSGFNLLTLGVSMILLMMPFTLFELAIGFSCPDYLTPIIIVSLAKMIGEYTSFYIGKELSYFLKTLLSEFKFFHAIEKLTQRKPYKTQFLMRMSGVTPQLIMNYGMGVLGTVSFQSFAIVQTIVSVPSTILAIFLGKQFHKIKDIFDSKHQESNNLIAFELSIIILGGISVACLVYYVAREYTKILKQEFYLEQKEISSNDPEATCEDIELENAI